MEVLLDRFVPTRDRRVRFPYAKALGILLRSILVEREPIYRQEETVKTFAPSAFGITEEEAGAITDDRIGRALDRLFDADRGTLLTEVVVRTGERFGVKFDEFHNDTTTVRFTGQYRRAKGRSIRGKRAPWITRGYSKDHRPDLKQLLYLLTTSSDGGVPIQFRNESGNVSDSTTHIETWEALRLISARPDFLYVADSKLCTRENMDYIDHRGGRFVTVIPKSRSEDSEFREWIQTHEPAWEKVWDRPNPRRKWGPRDRWWVFRYHIPSREAWPVIWVFGSLLALKQEETRRDQILKAAEDLEDLKKQLAGPRTRLRSRAKVGERVDQILKRSHVVRYMKVRIFNREDHTFRQERKGRPGPETKYRRVTKSRLDIEWEIDEDRIAYDRKSDGMYPLLTNDRALTPRQVLEAHKRQPSVEGRFRDLKSVHEIAPVFLKNEGRIEALFFLYFLAILVQGLIEREVRRSTPIFAEGIQKDCRISKCRERAIQPCFEGIGIVGSYLIRRIIGAHDRHYNLLARTIGLLSEIC